MLPLRHRAAPDDAVPEHSSTAPRILAATLSAARQTHALSIEGRARRPDRRKPLYSSMPTSSVVFVGAMALLALAWGYFRPRSLCEALPDLCALSDTAVLLSRSFAQNDGAMLPHLRAEVLAFRNRKVGGHSISGDDAAAQPEHDDRARDDDVGRLEGAPAAVPAAAVEAARRVNDVTPPTLGYSSVSRSGTGADAATGSKDGDAGRSVNPAAAVTASPSTPATAGSSLLTSLLRIAPRAKRRDIVLPAPNKREEGMYQAPAALAAMHGVVHAAESAGGELSDPAEWPHNGAFKDLQPADFLVGTYYHPVAKFGHFSCSYGTYLHANRFAYASAHGYQYDIDTEVHDASRPLPWQKILSLMRWLRRAKWVLLVDADAILTGFDVKLEDLVGDGTHDVILTRDMNGINTGIALFRSSPKTQALLLATYANLDYLTHPWWEQAAMSNILDTKSEFSGMVRPVPQRTLNSYPPGMLGPDGWWHPGDLVVHFPGTKGPDFAAAVVRGRSGELAKAFPACETGKEASAWEGWAPAVNATAAIARARTKAKAQLVEQAEEGAGAP